jgi:hypothetical protein
MTNWRYDENAGTDLATEITFAVERAAEYGGRAYSEGDELTINLPREIDRATLDDMAGEGGPFGWGGYTAEQLAALEAGRF